MSAIAQLIVTSGSATLSLSLSAGGHQGAASNTSNGHNFSANTATAKGGAGGYSYLWTITPIGFGTWTNLNPPTDATAYVQVDNVPLHQMAEALFTCTVTDALGNTASTFTTYTYTYGSPA